MKPATASASALFTATIPVLLICLGLSVLTQRPNPAPTPLTMATASQACTTPMSAGALKLQVGYPDDGFAASSEADGWHLRLRSWLSADICEPGMLRITGRGKEAGDALPRLEISLDGEKLGSEAFPKNGRSVAIRIPKAGKLSLAYLNDFYQSEYRMVIISGLSLEQPTCPTPITIAPTSAADWNADTTTASILKNPFIVTICEDGFLRFKIWGKEAQGVFPQARFKQNGQVVEDITTSADSRTVRVAVKAGELTIYPTNPYAVELADRNLDLEQVTFIPLR